MKTYISFLLWPVVLPFIIASFKSNGDVIFTFFAKCVAYAVYIAGAVVSVAVLALFSPLIDSSTTMGTANVELAIGVSVWVVGPCVLAIRKYYWPHTKIPQVLVPVIIFAGGTAVSYVTHWLITQYLWKA